MGRPCCAALQAGCHPGALPQRRSGPPLCRRLAGESMACRLESWLIDGLARRGLLRAGCHPWRAGRSIALGQARRAWLAGRARRRLPANAQAACHLCAGAAARHAAWCLVMIVRARCTPPRSRFRCLPASLHRVNCTWGHDCPTALCVGCECVHRSGTHKTQPRDHLSRS